MKTLIIALKFFLLMTLLTGLIYPLLVTGIAQLAFHDKANGSLIIVNHEIIGSKLVGQKFTSEKYFFSRPSACDYDGLHSGASNLGITSQKLKEQLAERKHDWNQENGIDSTTALPSEMMFASASGLDPHITPYAASIQVSRVAKARNFNSTQTAELYHCIEACTEKPQYLLLGEARVNVLLLNLATDKIK
jgi:K+-transporting ATPase ATPase C chain